MKIYSIEDNEDIALIINKTLSKQGYEVLSFSTGEEFFNSFEKDKPDIILLDLMLPDINGFEILKRIRKESNFDEVRIIIISAKHMISDKVEGLDLGADDYIEKPFDLLELMARVDAQARRIKKRNILTYNGIKIDLNQRTCSKNGIIVDLTNKEFDILYMLLENMPNVVSRDDIFKKIWDTNNQVESRTIDMHIKSLRNKINDDGSLIKTVYGIGYKI